MPQEFLNYSVLALCAAVISWLFRTPKESIINIERRLETIERLYNVLSGTHSKHDQSLENLTKSVDRLTERFDKFLERGNGREK